MQIIEDYLDKNAQLNLVNDITKISKRAPFFRPRIPIWNKPMRIKITNAGTHGWLCNKSGRAYVKEHPVTRTKWPCIPETLKKIWKEISKMDSLPNSCLINLYPDLKSRLGLHQDKDENNVCHPIISISLGSKALFRYGENKNRLKKKVIKSGTVLMFHKQSRLFYHSVDKIIPDEKSVLNDFKELYPLNSRINITLRKVTK